MRIVYFCLAILFVVIGIIGAFLPILPTVPFLLIAAFCAAKSSPKLHTWLTSSKFYKKHLSSWEKDKSMTKETKIKTLLLSSSMILTSFYFIPNLHVRIALLVILTIKYYVFIFIIKTQEKPNQVQKLNHLK